MRISSVIALAIVAVLLLPAAAAATVRKVEPAGSDSSDCDVVACKTVQYTVDQAETGDTVEIAAGTYDETVETSTNLSFVGAGEAATVIHGTDGAGGVGHPAFILSNGGSLNTLRAAGGEGDSVSVGPITTGYDGGDAIVFEPGGLGQTELELEDVFSVGGTGGSGTLNLEGNGGSALVATATEGGKSVSATDSTFVAGEGGFLGSANVVVIDGGAMSAKIATSAINTADEFTSGLLVSSGASALVESSVVYGFFGAGTEGGSLTVKSSLLEGVLGAIFVTPGSDPSAEALVVDSIVSSEGTTAQVTSGSGPGISKLTARGSTIVSDGGPGPAVGVEAETTGLPVSAVLRNTIAIHIPEGAEPERDLVANFATIDAQFSNFSTSITENGGSAPAPGGGTNVGGKPGFAPEALFLTSNSPLIDRGDPSIVESDETDIEGSPRSLDGNHDCIAAPDIGAFEVVGQSSACPPKVDAFPVVSGFSITNRKFVPKGKAAPAKASAKGVKRGTKFTYTLSEAARVAIKIERRKPGKSRHYAKVTSIGGLQRSGKGSTPFSGKVKGRPMKPGKYRATITATDAAGQASVSHRLGFTVVSG